ncbi:MAG TPA: hypothetical protein O0X69_02660 [Methanocorpusculum sp.]|nr:hypothetical protein [Methanocorpusculum sp.]
MVTKKEWDSLKAMHGNKCVICGQMDTNGTLLEKAHLKAQSKGGTQVIPLCPTCHTKYDKGLLSDAQLRIIGVKPEDYGKMRPKKPEKKFSGVSSSPSYAKVANINDIDDIVFGSNSTKNTVKKSTKKTGSATKKPSQSSGFDSLFGTTSTKKPSSKKPSKSSSRFDDMFGGGGLF